MSGQKNNGTLTNMSSSTVPVPGKIGQGIKVSGTQTSEGVLFPALVNQSTFTISVWVKPAVTSRNYNSIVDGSTLYGLFMRGSGSSYKLDFFQSGPHISTTGLTPNVWNHVVFSNNSNTGTFYINGVSNGTGVLTTNAGLTKIGYDGTANEQMNGSFDDVRIYNRALTAREVQELYQIGTAKFNNSPVSSLASGLVGYWTFDGQNTNWAKGLTYDMSGRKNNGTLTNMSSSTAPVPGKIGQGLKFDGVNDFVDVTSNFPTGDISFAFWIKTVVDSSNTKVPISWNISARFCRFESSTPTIFRCTFDGNTTGAVNASGVNDGQWHHIVVTNLSNNQVMYKDGVSGSTGSETAGSIGTAMRLGCLTASCGATNYFKGNLDDVRIYNRALSATEVRQLYQLGR